MIQHIINRAYNPHAQAQRKQANNRYLPILKEKRANQQH